MVAEMLSFGATTHLDEGDGDVPTADQKGNLTESDNSGSENAGTSAEESSEEEEDGDEEEEDSGLCAGKEAVKGEPDEPEASATKDGSIPEKEGEDTSLKEEMSFKHCCEKCKDIQQNPESEMVTPRTLAKGRMQLQLDGEGTYQCSLTGLVFEVSEPVTLRYSVLSWSRFTSYLQHSWRFAGPIFDMNCVDKPSSVLSSIRFPHSLCLADPQAETSFRILHVKGGGASLEPVAAHTGGHVQWHVSSLSPVGVVVPSDQQVAHHGAVLVYKVLSPEPTYSFRIYLATNSSSDIKDIQKEVRSSKRRFMKIEKPPTCHLDQKHYRLVSEPEGEISEDLLFTYAVTRLKGYFEAVFELPPPFKLSLIETDSDKTVWTATIRSEDCVDIAVDRMSKRTERRKRSSSTSEEELTNKKPRCRDESDGMRTDPTPDQDLSEKDLFKVAKKLGKEWKQVAIFLDLSSQELEGLQAAEKDVDIQKWNMLVKWKSRRTQGEATAWHLWKSLEELEDLPAEVHQVLKDMMRPGK